jgi:hypothetical protein
MHVMLLLDHEAAAGGPSWSHGVCALSKVVQEELEMHKVSVE